MNRGQQKTRSGIPTYDDDITANATGAPEILPENTIIANMETIAI